MTVENQAKKMLNQAYQDRVTDIHVLPEEEQFMIYFRQTNHLTPYQELSLAEGKRLIAYFKFLGDMDVAESRRPQNGSATFSLEGGEKDVRLSTMTNYLTIESLVIRLLNQTSEIDLIEGSYFPDQVEILRRLVRYQSGLLLFSGPVGSGKTTSMYQLIKEVQTRDSKQVITIEDPVEIQEKQFLQMQVNPSANITYDLLLKQSLRHHPDILIIGEIRDEETAAAVVRGALTGHLILATIHAKDAEGVISRMTELGVSKDLLSQTLIGIVFQKMLPRQDRQANGVLYDIRYQESLQALLENKPAETHFNFWLKEAMHNGYISKKTHERYLIP